MICAGSGRHAPQAIAGTAHTRPIGYCPHCSRAHALTNAGTIWKHRTTTEPLPTEDDMTDRAKNLTFTGLPEPTTPELPADLCQFCYELADEMAVHNRSDVMTEYAEIHHHAHVPAPVGTIIDGLIDAVPSSAPDDWAEQIDEQRKRAEAAEAERDELADALRDLDRHITNVTRSMLDK